MRVPLYASCYKCGEYRYAVLRMECDKVVCFNCSAYAANKPQAYCFICNEIKKVLKPCEQHHVYGRKYHPLCIWLCVNCHRYLESPDGHVAKTNLMSLIDSMYYPEIFESENVPL